MSKSPTITDERVGPVLIAQLRRSPTHPGEMFAEEFLIPTGTSQAEAARRMGMPANRLNTIIVGKRGVSPETAILFGALTGTNPEFWMRLQADYDLWRAMQKMPRPKVKPLTLAAAQA